MLWMPFKYRPGSSLPSYFVCNPPLVEFDIIFARATIKNSDQD